jgi:xanthine dehydrogenase accessory factor
MAASQGKPETFESWAWQDSAACEQAISERAERNGLILHAASGTYPAGLTRGQPLRRSPHGLFRRAGRARRDDRFRGISDLSAAIRSVLPLFTRERQAGRALVLATVVRTEGPTYTKPGAVMLIAQSGEYAGLLSGGCLEGDLAEHGHKVLQGGTARLLRYDSHGPEDLLFGLGSGCEGAMEILLQRLDLADNWQPMTRLASAWQARRSEGLLLVARSEDPAILPGCGAFLGDTQTFGFGGTGAAPELATLVADYTALGASRYLPQVLPGIDILQLIESPSPRLLLLGAGPDAQPVAELSSFLGWSITVIDHRPRYAQVARFPGAERVLDGGPPSLLNALKASSTDTERYAAAIVMSHHFVSDRHYLAALATSDIPYIGLLGPAMRRERLLEQLGPQAALLGNRLHSPIGLDLGAGSPEEIALAIVAEIQATLAGRDGTRSLSARRVASPAPLQSGRPTTETASR